jgi:hypothetical protein
MAGRGRKANMFRKKKKKRFLSGDKCSGIDDRRYA